MNAPSQPEQDIEQRVASPLLEVPIRAGRGAAPCAGAESRRRARLSGRCAAGMRYSHDSGVRPHIDTLAGLECTGISASAFTGR
jgi:hypothetical protein